MLGYDYLIMATGVSANFFGVAGADKHSLSLYTRRDAVVVRERLMDELEQRSWGWQSADLNITVAGGGATGVELAGTLAELRNIALPATFPEIDPVHVTCAHRAGAVAAGPTGIRFASTRGSSCSAVASTSCWAARSAR